VLVGEPCPQLAVRARIVAAGGRHRANTT
jgi:hypothetical protein